MKNFTLAALISSAGERMRLDLRERLVEHPGELGTDREEIVREFLRKYLPKRFEVSTGFVFDCHGNVSQQLDIIIVSSAASSRFETAGGTRYYPCECVVAAGQVKSSMTSTEVFESALANLESVKRLDRSANGKAICMNTGEPLDNERYHLDQIFTFLLVTGKCLSEAKVSSTLRTSG